MAIRFLEYYVTDGTHKARIHYSSGPLIDGTVCVTLYAKRHDDGDSLAAMFPESYKNDTDMQTDYFQKGLVRVVLGDPLYPAALARATMRTL